ncbi:MAG: glycosyltransferase family 2 protein [Bacteroides stercoris]
MKKNNKILTVGIAAYNMELYLSRCLDSLVCIENLNDVEILIVNDGSTDATLQIAQEYESLYSQSVRALINLMGMGSVVNLVVHRSYVQYFVIARWDIGMKVSPLSEFVSRLSAVLAIWWCPLTC